jgi:hypothetical protein
LQCSCRFLNSTKSFLRARATREKLVDREGRIARSAPFLLLVVRRSTKAKRNDTRGRNYWRSDFLERNDIRRVNKITKTNLIHDRDQPLASGDKFCMRDFVAATIGKVDAKRPESGTSYLFLNSSLCIPKQFNNRSRSGPNLIQSCLLRPMSPFRTFRDKCARSRWWDPPASSIP